jgi:phenylacetate-CoA ligase
MGANIYPEDIESIVYGDAELARRLHSFILAVATDASGTPRPEIAVEVAGDEVVDPAWAEALPRIFREGLDRLNLDYREALSEFPEAMEPIVSIHAAGTGPFAGDAHRIKPRRIAAPS